MKRIFLMLMLMAAFTTMSAQRTTDKLDRGLVAVPGQSGGNFVSWKIFGEEYYDTEYNLYCNGTKLNSKPLRTSNFQHTSGNAQSRYQVAAVVRGVEQEKSKEVGRWSQQYFDIPVSAVQDRNGTTVTSEYELNDVSLADVTGDGVPEFIVKRNFAGDILNSSNKTKFHHYECYTLSGKRLWWIDLGPNLMAGPDEQWDIVGFDWDQDGKAECVMRGADNMIFHTASGKIINIGNMNYTAPRDEYTHQGAEYLIYFNGETGEPFAWDGQSQTFTPMEYPLPRFEKGESDYATAWGKADTGHRSSKHYFGAPFLDGRHASIFLGRGCYTRHKMCALDVNPQTHELTQRWRWDNNGGWNDPWFGNGFHNFAIADVDWDGRDEIVFGSMIIDDNGKGLCTTGNGHGDAQHCADLDPYRHGQEQFTCNEDEPACTYYNATTGQIYYRLQSTSDDGRALCANFSNSYPGSLGRTTQTGLVSTVADKVITGGPATADANDALFWSHLNFRIYWDGDLCDEVLDSPGSNARDAAVYKPGGGRLLTTSGCSTNNSSKNNPCASADIFGDWREEIVVRTSDNTKLRIYTTNIPTEYRIYTLWHDHQYRNGMVWQCVGYNQPPHKSFFLGQMEGITVAPPPFTMTGRTEIKNGGTISAANDDEHVIVCETNDTKVTVADGAKPHVATFNVPSWVQGTNSPLLNGKAKIDYQYYTCTVSGGAFTGDMRLVKQGDGILTLPAVEQTYTGNTDIWAGTLNFDGKLLQSSLWLNRFAELNSDGGQFRSIKMDYDSKLRPGGAGKAGVVTTDSLILGFGSRLVLDLFNDGMQADQLNTKVLEIETKNWQYGPKNLTPVVEFVAHLGADTEIAQGRYFLGEVGELNGDLTKLKIEGLGNSHKTQLVLEDGKLYVEVSGLRDAGTVYWNGTESNAWNLGGAENFLAADGEKADVFVSGDKVYFTDNAKLFNVSLEGEIEADSIIVDNTKAYTFAGNGSIIGNTVLVKRGTGNLTIRTDNTYTGGTRISDGAVIVTSLSNANQAVGNLGGVVTSNAKFVIENGAELRTTAAVTQGSPMRMDTPEGGVIQNSADFIVNKAISGTKLTKRGSGWMKLNIANSVDTMVVAAGTVQCVSCSTPARNVVYHGGTLRENAGTSYAVNVPKGKTGTWYLANRSTYSNKITGAGTLTIYGVTEKGSNYYATRTPIQCNFSDFEGTIKPTSSVDDPALLRFTLNVAGSCPKGTFDIASGVEVQNSGKTFTIGKVSGAGSLGGSCTFSNGASVGANTWRVGNDDNFTWEGKVTSNALFQKIGEGKMTVKGAWLTSGSVAVNAGELAFTSAASLGTGALTVAKGAVLSGITSVSGSLKNSAYTINGTLQVGSSKVSTSGVINLNDKNVTFGKESTYIVGASRCATASNNGCTSLQGVNRLVMNGTISVFLADNHNLQAGDSIRIFVAKSFGGSPTFDLPEIGNGLDWDTSRISEGLLFVKVSTGIDALLTDKNGKGVDIYNASGQLVRRHARSLEGLPRGVYFVRGRKIVVK